MKQQRVALATEKLASYLTAVIDLFSRQLVSRSMKEGQTSVVTDALRMAWFRRSA